MTRTARATLAAALLLAPPALAQSPEWMAEDCRNAALVFFDDFQLPATTTYAWESGDGGHAVDGTVEVDGRSEAVLCIYDAAGTTLTGFTAEGRSWPGFVAGEGSPHAKGAATQAAAPAETPDDGITVEEVRFAPGTSGTQISGELTGRAIADYTLRAAQGQVMRVSLSRRGPGTVYFNVLPPGSRDVAVFVGSREGDAAEVPLTEAGVWTVRVYLMGASRDEGGTVAYDLGVGIE